MLKCRALAKRVLVQAQAASLIWAAICAIARWLTVPHVFFFDFRYCLSNVVKRYLLPPSPPLGSLPYYALAPPDPQVQNTEVIAYDASGLGGAITAVTQAMTAGMGNAAQGVAGTAVSAADVASGLELLQPPAMPPALPAAPPPPVASAARLLQEGREMEGTGAAALAEGRCALCKDKSIVAEAQAAASTEAAGEQSTVGSTPATGVDARSGPATAAHGTGQAAVPTDSEVPAAAGSAESQPMANAVEPQGAANGGPRAAAATDVGTQPLSAAGEAAQPQAVPGGTNTAQVKAARFSMARRLSDNTKKLRDMAQRVGRNAQRGAGGAGSLAIIVELMRSLQFLYTTSQLARERTDQFATTAGTFGWAAYQVCACIISSGS